MAPRQTRDTALRVDPWLNEVLRREEIELGKVQAYAYQFARRLEAGIPNRQTKFELMRQATILERMVREAPVVTPPEDYN